MMRTNLDQGHGGPVVLALIACVVAGVYAWRSVPGCYRLLDEGPKIAAHLARGDGFVNPIDASPASPPTSWLPPVYPLLMAGVYRVWGVATPASLDVMLAVNVACFGLLVAAAAVLGRRCFGPPAGWVAGLLVLLYPTFLLRTVYCWDTYLALAAFGWLAVAALRLGERRARITDMLLLGAALGLLVLLNASYALAVPVLVLLAVRGGWPVSWPRRGGVGIAASVLGFCLVLTPWTVRNYRVFHQVFFVRGGVNLELWLGNRPGNGGWMELSQHPSVNRAEGAQMLRMGDVAYYRLCGERFHADLRASPAAFVRRTANRVVYILFGNPRGDATALVRGSARSGWLRVAADVLSLAAGVAGAVVAARRRLWGGVWLLVLGAAAVAPFAITQVAYRYTMPLRLMTLVAAGGLSLWVPRRRVG